MATNPSRDLIANIEALKGQPRVSYENAETSFPQTERVVEVLRAKAPLTYLSAEPDTSRFADLKLIEQSVVGSSQTHLKLYCKYAKVPGPVLPAPSRIDDDAAAVTATMQRKAVADIVTNETLTGSGPYVWTRNTKGDGNGVVAMQISESRAIPGEETTEYLRDKQRGSITRKTQLIRKDDVPAGGAQPPVESSGIVTEINYLKVPGSRLVMQKVTDTFALADCLPWTEERVDQRMNTKIVEAWKIVLASSISTSSDIDAGKLVVTEREDYQGSADVAIRHVTTIYPPEANSEGSALVEARATGYRWPSRINIPFLDAYGTAVGYEVPEARMIEAKVKRWWVIAETKPTLTIERIIPRTIVINDVKYPAVLHDATTRIYNGTPISYPSTIPSYTAYVTGWIGVEKLIDGEAKATKFHKLWEVEAVYVVHQ